MNKEERLTKLLRITRETLADLEEVLEDELGDCALDEDCLGWKQHEREQEKG